jgi:hypothetical protein
MMTTVVLLPIPAGTKPQKCFSCGQRMFWAKHPKTGNPHPISVAHANAVEPTATEGGFGISHFADCKFAAQHRRTR